MPRKPENLTTQWISELAEPYLRGYRAKLQSSGSLRGYWFFALGAKGARRPSSQTGFFVGYLVRSDDWDFVQPQPPECLVFAFARPGGAAHRRLVLRQDGLIRKTFHYIRWLTHRPPRFAFYEDQLPAMVRHASMRDWPRKRWEHFSRNFFIETLAWLVRSGLVRKLAGKSFGTADERR